MMKMIRKTTIVLLSSMFLIAMFALGVQAKEVEKPLELEVSSISGISMMEEVNLTAASMPELTSGTHQKWVDRVKLSSEQKSFYNHLVEGSDNDYVNDFLINPSEGNQVKTFEVEYVDENDKTKTGMATGYPLYSISAQGRNEETIIEDFYNKFEKYYNDQTVVLEAFMMDHPKVFWLNSVLFFSVSDLEADQLSNGTIRLRGKIYCVLKLEDKNGNEIFDVRHEKYDETSIRTTIAEINNIIVNVVNEVQHEDTASQIRHFNQYLVNNNEINSSEDLDEIVYDHPEIYTCVSALRGTTGAYAPGYTSYTLAFKALCDHAGIPNTIELSDLGKQSVYLWNMVQVDGKWYGVDCSANDHGYNDKECVLLAGKNTIVYDGHKLGEIYNSNGKSDVLSGIAFSNCPPIADERYEYAVKELSLLVSNKNYMYGYMDAPVITANSIYADAQDGAPTYAWFLVNDQGYLTQFGGSEDTVTFPDVTRPGTHRVICEARLRGTARRAETTIEVTIFEDINESDWFYKAIDWSIANGVTYGYTTSAFAPYIPCTRAQIVTFIWRAAGSPEPVNKENHFQDVKESDYFYKATLWAVENKILSGYTPELFAPNVACTRAEMVTFLWRNAGRVEVEDKVHPFKDVRADGFYYNAMLWAVEEGIAKGYTADMFAPNVTVTRSETVTFLYRADGNANPPEKNDGPSKILEMKESADEEGVLFHIPNAYVENGLMQEVKVYENHLLVWGNGMDEEGLPVVNIAILNMSTGELIQKNAFANIELADVDVCGEWIVLTDSATGDVVVLDGGLQIIKEYKGEHQYGSVYVNEDVSKIYTFTSEDGIQIKDIASGEVTVLLDDMINLYAGERIGNIVSFNYTDTETNMSEQAVIDLNSGEILKAPFKDAYSGVQYCNGFWFASSYDDTDTYYVGTEDAVYSVEPYGERTTLSVITNPDRLIAESNGKEGIAGLSIYNQDGTFVSSINVKEEGTSYFYDPVWIEKDGGYYFILTSSEGKDMLMFWDLSVETEGDDLVYEKNSEDDLIGTEVSKELYEKANTISEAYGIEVKIAEFCMTESANYVVEQTMDEELIAAALNHLEQVLKSYPDGFFEQLKYGGQRVIEVHLSGDLALYDKEDESYTTVGGFANSVGSKNNIVVDITAEEDALIRTFHHEIMHQIDFRMMYDANIREDAAYSEDVWRTLNPYSFKYVEEYEELPDGYYNDGYEDWFIDNYARNNSKEDRARIFEYAMIGDADRFPEGCGTRNKLEYLSECIRDTFDTTSWPEVTVWEEIFK